MVRWISYVWRGYFYNMKFIPLINSDKLVKVDDSDYEYLLQFVWRLSSPAPNKYYAQTDKSILMHRLILNLTDSNIWGDHKDSDGLNNQRNNLRTCNKIQNGYNAIKHTYRKGIPLSSKYKGVSYSKKDGKWKVSITAKDAINNPAKVEQNRIFIGMFDDEISAGIAYNHAALKYHGEFAKINLIPGWENIIPKKSDGGFSSKYNGVWFNNRTESWVATIKNDETGEKHNKYFDLELHAAVYYNIKNLEFNGDNGKINNINDWQNITPIPRNPERKYIGVGKNRQGTWRATLCIGKLHLHLGTFKTEDEAALAYNKKAIELLGDKAKLNVIEE